MNTQSFLMDDQFPKVQEILGLVEAKKYEEARTLSLEVNATAKERGFRGNYICELMISLQAASKALQAQS